MGLRSDPHEWHASNRNWMARRVDAWKDISVAGLPSAPEKYYAFHEDPTRPQPRMERSVGDGMTTTIGRVEKEELFDNGLKYILFSHNKKMGSAKGAVLLAEMLHKKGKI